ncbi:hypothetical protein BJ878DRAFT_545314 [Calycina marina]|uniref:Retrovirus-related Pol polyprotein from transposon TNT 1-94-like beta-barrel domain-containing protein n=1 Tax=Calycina marina TaxID=1763456 RepID=A0A9P7YWP1_9HELO|nr:hypothetical protein BJ878DRAFT_545314 [Calycina marina]
MEEKEQRAELLTREAGLAAFDKNGRHNTTSRNEPGSLGAEQLKARGRVLNGDLKAVSFNRKDTGRSAVKKKTAKTFAAAADEEPSRSDDHDEYITDETAALVRDLRSKHIIPPSIWAFDTGCSRHMTDQHDLFRKLETIPQRSIRAGGGGLPTFY